MTVVVFGSINMDLVVQVPRLPVAGETLPGHTFFTAPGGKGANQAVAAARLGAPTSMIGRVGGDVFGTTLRDQLRADGVDVANVVVDAAVPSGVALIQVDAAAQNTIVVVAGANGTHDVGSLQQLTAALDTARVLLLQLEIPLEMVVAAARAAHERGVITILDPAPARSLPAELYGLVDILTPNQSEAAALTGVAVQDAAGAAQAAKLLRDRGVARVVVKLGEQGAYWASQSDEAVVPPFTVEAVDTVAAGDAFNGGLAAALVAEQPWTEALRWAMAAGALATTKPGAQPALPNRDEVMKLLR